MRLSSFWGNLHFWGHLYFSLSSLWRLCSFLGLFYFDITLIFWVIFFVVFILRSSLFFILNTKIQRPTCSGTHRKNTAKLDMSSAVCPPHLGVTARWTNFKDLLDGTALQTSWVDQNGPANQNSQTNQFFNLEASIGGGSGREVRGGGHNGPAHSNY